MAARARQLGVALRPHAKTHKCVALGKLQLQHGARGLTVSTLVEAEAFARAGVTDLTWAFPIDPGHVAHARRIGQETGATLRVVVGFAGRLRKEGIAIREVSVGSTPAMAAATDLTGITEARPGNYVFYDRTMVLIGCCEPADVGVSVLATVVSHQPGASHFVVDAGALELSKDTGPTHVGPQAMGAVKGAPDLTVATLSQEHGLIRAASAASLDGRFKVGDRVEIIPN